MAVEILEVDPPATVPIVELCVVERPRGAAEREPGSLHSLQDGVEFDVADVERIMMALERFHVVVEEQRERFVDAHRRKVTVSTLEFEPEELREKAGRSLLVARRNDGVVEHDRHRPPSAVLECPFVYRSAWSSCRRCAAWKAWPRPDASRPPTSAPTPRPRRAVRQAAGGCRAWCLRAARAARKSRA